MPTAPARIEFDHLDAVAPIEHVQGAFDLLDQARDRECGRLKLDDRHVRMRPMQRHDAAMAQADAQILGRILDADRNRRGVGDRAEEPDQLRLRHILDRWRLQDRPFGTRGRCRLHELDLTLDAGLGHRDRERNGVGHVLGDPVQQGATLGRRELVNLRCHAENGDAVRLVPDDRLDLTAHRLPRQPALGVEQREHHRIDAREPGAGLHRSASFRRGLRKLLA